jgi:hypothetical protein
MYFEVVSFSKRNYGKNILNVSDNISPVGLPNVTSNYTGAHVLLIGWDS